MKSDLRKRCSDWHTPTGRLQCEKICRFNFCCFAEGEDSCRDNPFKMCNEYAACKILSGTSSVWVEEKEDVEPMAQVVLISLGLEAEMHGDEVDDYFNDAVEEIEAGKEDEEGKDNEQAVVSKETSAPTPKPTPEPTPKFTPEPPLEPTLEPTPPPTPEPTPSPKEPAKVNTVKPPPPPPIRCIPDGDDEIHTEVYSNDWNDDRYNHCKRWEIKHGMTIDQY